MTVCRANSEDESDKPESSVLPWTSSFLPRSSRNRQSSSIPIRFSFHCADRLKMNYLQGYKTRAGGRESLSRSVKKKKKIVKLLTLLWKVTQSVNPKAFIKIDMKTEATWTGKEEKLCLKATSTRLLPCLPYKESRCTITGKVGRFMQETFLCVSVLWVSLRPRESW